MNASGSVTCSDFFCGNFLEIFNLKNEKRIPNLLQIPFFFLKHILQIFQKKMPFGEENSSHFDTGVG
jgi:hypothetical protein